MSLRRVCRSGRWLGRRVLTLSDNPACVGAFEKGRSSRSHGLLALCQRSAAYQLACAIQWRLRYIETDRNVADEGSRRRELSARLASSIKAASCVYTPSGRKSDGQKRRADVRDSPCFRHDTACRPMKVALLSEFSPTPTVQSGSNLQ